MRKIPWQSRKELHLQLAASCGVYHGLPPWFSMHFKSIATFLAKSANEKKNPFGRRKVASAECELNVDHITITLQTSGCGHSTFGFRRAPATAWTWWCILANKGFTNLAIVTKFSPLPEPCNNGKTTTCGSVYRARSVNGEVDGSGCP